MSLKPYTCPVCNGNGLVPNGFYNQTSGHWSTTNASPEKCRACDGRGLVYAWLIITNVQIVGNIKACGQIIML